MAGGSPGARSSPTTPPRGMNAAVERGLDEVATTGAEAALVLTADLAARPARATSRRSSTPPDRRAVLVPSRDGTGTNAMLLRPPTACTPRLGLDSLAPAPRPGRRAGLAAIPRELPALALDIDTPATCRP